MALTLDTAIDSILGALKTAWDAGTPALNDGVVPHLVFEFVERDLKPHPRDSLKPWARAVVRHMTAAKVTLANDQGTARYRRTGIVWVQIFVPTDAGAAWTKVQQLAAIVQGAYEGKRAGDVVFTSSAIIDKAGDGAFTQADVKTTFYWDQIR